MKRENQGGVTLLTPETKQDLLEIARLDAAGVIDTRLSFGDHLRRAPRVSVYPEAISRERALEKKRLRR